MATALRGVQPSSVETDMILCFLNPLTPSQISVTFNGDLLSVKLFKYKLQMLQDGWLMLASSVHQDFNIPDAIYISWNTGSTVAVKLLMTTERL